MNTFKWGIIGTGNIANNFITAVESIENSVVYGVGSRNLETAEQFATKNNIDNYYGSYLELMTNSSIDAIYIATPISIHYENIKLALLNNKHVLCEKTITTTSDQLIELQQLAKQQNLFLMEGLWTKCLPTYRLAKEWVENGLIGDVQFVDVQLSNMFEIDNSNHRFNQQLGGGALLDSGVYAISLALDFMGNHPCEIMTTTYHNHGIDFDSYITLKYQDKKFAHIITGFSTQNKCSATIIGTNGIIEFPNNFHYNSKIKLYDQDHKLVKDLDLPFEKNGFEYEIKEAQDCIRSNRLESDLIPLETSISTLKVIETCRNN